MLQQIHREKGVLTFESINDKISEPEPSSLTEVIADQFLFFNAYSSEHTGILAKMSKCFVKEKENSFSNSTQQSERIEKGKAHASFYL